MLFDLFIGHMTIDTLYQTSDQVNTEVNIDSQRAETAFITVGGQ